MENIISKALSGYKYVAGGKMAVIPLDNPKEVKIYTETELKKKYCPKPKKKTQTKKRKTNMEKLLERLS
jgi:hypothetical protein